MNVKKQKLIQQGAEAKIFLVKNKIIKDRIKKSYRLPKLDEKIRKQRTKSEAKILDKLQNIIAVPKTKEANKNKIIMDYIKGEKLSDCLDKIKNKNKIAELIGKNIERMHLTNIIHGDLTTSNMILSKNKVYFIDFGLSFHSHRIEDKAVDLHLLKQALEARHFRYFKELFKIIIKNYNPEDKQSILEQLKKVEKRGRYKH